MNNEFKGAVSLFAGQIEETRLANAALTDPETTPTYEKDGLKFCGVCNEPKQKNVPCIGLVNIDCLCQQQKKAKADEARRKKAADERRKVAFGSVNSKKFGFTFQADDRRNPLASQQIAAYVEQFSDHRRSGRGLLLYSPYNGGGKTFFSSAVANDLIDRGFSVRVTKFADLRDEMTDFKSFGHLNRVDFLRKLCALDLIVIDDLGAENDTQYSMEVEYRIIDELTDNGVPLIITTNHTPKEMDNVSDRAKKRIFDRVLGNCIPIKVDPPEKVNNQPISRRIEQCKQNTIDFRGQIPPNK